MTICFKDELTVNTQKLDDAIANLKSSFEFMSESARRETLATLGEVDKKLTVRQDEFDQRLNLEPKVMEIRGFMKIGNCLFLCPVPLCACVCVYVYVCACARVRL